MRPRHYCRAMLAAIVVIAGYAPVASAADMPLKAPRAPVYMLGWSGLYVGVNGGYATATSNWIDDPTLGSSDLGGHKPNGGFVGGQIGYNWQYGIVVAGIEAELAWASLRGSHVDPFLHNLSTKVTSVGAITGRLGFAYWDRVLIYGKGGLGYAQFKYEDFVTLGGALNGNASSARWGYALGAGIEYAFAPNMSAKIEYTYLGFNSKRVDFGSGVFGGYSQDIKNDIQLVKAGLNFRVSP